MEMTDDYTKEIKERLAAATPGKCIGVRESGLLIMERENDIDDIHKFHRKAPTDIANLLAEREVLREAIKYAIGPTRDVKTPRLMDALAWEPGK